MNDEVIVACQYDEAKSKFSFCLKDGLHHFHFYVSAGEDDPPVWMLNCLTGEKFYMPSSFIDSYIEASSNFADQIHQDAVRRIANDN